MPSILEQIIPSWMQDGLGIIGQQTDVNLEEDTPWDTNVWTTGEPEQVQILPSCCCRDTAIVTFTGVTFDCPCARFGIGGIITGPPLIIGKGYQIVNYFSGDDFTNVGALNVTGDIFDATGTTPNIWTHGSTLQRVQSESYTDVSLNGSHTLTKFDICPPNLICALFGSCTMHEKAWDSSTCTGLLIVDSNVTLQISLGLLDGLWYLFVTRALGIPTSGQIFFYGTAASLSDGFSNVVTCDFPTGNNYFIPFCPPGSTNLFPGLAEGGSATIT